jgi:hypothetical protein
MSELSTIAPAFAEMAHRIVWASVATVDARDRPRSRVLHPIWEWDGTRLVGWIATSADSVKTGDLAAHPYATVNYWAPDQDVCTADCEARMVLDDDVRTWLWERFKSAPEPVGYDPVIIPQWSDGPTGPVFAALRLDPYRLRVMPGTVMTRGEGELLTWKA